MQGPCYGPRGYWVYEPNPVSPNENRLMYQSSDAEVQQLQQGIESMLCVMGDLAVSFHDGVLKPISWWSTSIFNRLFG